MPESNPFLRLAAPAMAALQPYVPGKPVEELQRELGLERVVKLASNENPLGPSPTLNALWRDEWPDLGRYPDGSGFELKDRLAGKLGLDAAQITLGNGSNDVLDLIARAFLGPGREAVYSRYAFAVYPIAIQSVGASAVVAPADGRYGHDLDAMRGAVSDRTRVVFVANPNNPTGGYLSAERLLQFVRDLPDHTMVVIDEAYFEYVEADDYPDAVAWLDQFPNLIVTRTFSKAYGLAALRLGYGLSHPQVADLLNRVRQPFNVNSLALRAGCLALEDQAHIARSIELNRVGMAFLTEQFRRLRLDYIPSVGNFVTMAIAGAATVDRQLLRMGCIVRPIANYGMPDHLRVSIGTEEENRFFVDCLVQVLAG
jgi:histidinol-phosphate aminotransferase